MTARLIEDVDVVMFVGDPAELRERLEIEVGWPDELPMPPQASFAVIISIPGSSAPGSKAEFE